MEEAEYICVDGPLSDTRIKREPKKQGPMQAILLCPDERRAVYIERGNAGPGPVVYGGLYFKGYVE